MTFKNRSKEHKIRKASESASNQQQKIEGHSTPDLSSTDIFSLQGVIGNQAVQRLLKDSRVNRPIPKKSLSKENRDEQNVVGLPILSPSPLMVARAPGDAPPPGTNLPTVDANNIPKTWRQSPVPSSGGQDVFLYRGLEKGAAQASSQIIRSADVAAGGFTSTELSAAQDAVFNAYGRDPVLSGPNAGGVVRVKIPGAVWDQLVKTNNISQRSYGGFSGGMSTSELRINTQEAASLINSLPNDVIAPDPYYDRRPNGTRTSRPAPVPPFGAGSKGGGQASEPAVQPGESVPSSERPTGRFRAVNPPAQSSESAPTETTEPTVPTPGGKGPITPSGMGGAGVPPANSPGFSPGTRAVAGGLGILVVVNEILGPIARVRNQQQHNIDEGNAQINFLRRFGANPKMGIWDQTERKPLPPNTTPSTSLFGSPSYPYVVDVDINAFRANLPRLITDYQSYVYFISTAKELNLLDEDPEMPVSPTRAQRAEERHYYLKVNMEDRASRRRYDITDTIMQVQNAVVSKVDKTMRAKLQGLPAAQQSNVFRLKQGSETPVYRSARGHQPILSSKQLFGSDPWVRPTGKKFETSWWQSFQHGQSDDRLLVVPANGDAERSAQVSAYWVHEPIEDVFDEVKEGGRSITDRQPADGGPLNSFVAGPEPNGDSRFGETRYFRHPDPDVRWTEAIGELRQFWVNASDLEPVSQSQVSTYINQDSPDGNQKPK